MSKNKIQWIRGCIAIVVLCLLSMVLRPSLVHSETFYISCIYVVVNAFAFIIGYAILLKHSSLTFWKFAAYLIVIVGASLAINFLLFEVLSKSMEFFALIVFVVLASLNFALWKIIFHADVRQAFLVGMLVGLINTFICFMGTTVPN